MSTPPADRASEDFNALVDRFPSINLTVLAHFYRGELARSIAWRQKMDMTTHWAILTTTALISVAFSQSGITHAILPFGSILLTILLNVEGRRYRYYDAWRTRVRMLEVHMVVPALAHKHPLLEGDWREALCQDLMIPAFKISYFESLSLIHI